MAEYISKAEAIEAIRQTFCPNCDSCNGIMCKACGYKDCMDIVDDVKAADVQPVIDTENMKAATMKELYEARELVMQAVSELCEENKPDISAFHYRIGFTEGLTLAIDILSKGVETND